MATIFEMARALGEELQKTPQVEALVAAKAAYESDPEIAKLVEEYTKLHYDFEAKMNAGGISIEEQRAFNEQMKAKGEAIRTNKLASDLYVAEQNFNNFVNSVFNIITATLTGEEPEQPCLLSVFPKVCFVSIICSNAVSGEQLMLPSKLQHSVLSGF